MSAFSSLRKRHRGTLKTTCIATTHLASMFPRARPSRRRCRVAGWYRFRLRSARTDITNHYDFCLHWFFFSLSFFVLCLLYGFQSWWIEVLKTWKEYCQAKRPRQSGLSANSRMLARNIIRLFLVLYALCPSAWGIFAHPTPPQLATRSRRTPWLLDFTFMYFSYAGFGLL